MQRANKTDKSFSYPVYVQGLSGKPVQIHLEAGADAMQQMRKRWGVAQVRSVTANVEVSRWKRDGVRVKGRVQADLTQNCVVSLDPFEARIDEKFEALFVPEGSKLARSEPTEEGEILFDPEGADSPETFGGNTLDIGPVCEEFIVLAIDPYPRKEGATFETEAENNSAPEDDSSPFLKLQGWEPAKRR